MDQQEIFDDLSVRFVYFSFCLFVLSLSTSQGSFSIILTRSFHLLREFFFRLSRYFVFSFFFSNLFPFKAHWFYEDFYRRKYKLPKYTLERFVELMFHHCPSLQPYASGVRTIYKDFKEYKSSVPVCGCILLNR